MEYKIMYEGNTENGYGPKGLCLEKIFSIRLEGDGFFTLTEECDGFWNEKLSKDAVLRMIEELKHFVETN